MDVFAPVEASDFIRHPFILHQERQHGLVLLQSEDTWVMVIDHDPFVFRIDLTVLCAFVAVIAVYARIERTGQDDPHCGRRPFCV